ncbi:MAG TPA: glycine betaine/L-proline ABC transporter ATP-binding protein, partial [Tichowtungia sp.]|nr:glycine betaine/L-proline ABC transporter ATP-binding protein [Tichowtungia sp.]
MSVIKVNNLFKVFGHDPKRTFPLIEKGKSKEEILDETGCTVGINDASFEIQKKEIFVLMGLSGSGKSTVIRCLNRLIEPTRGEVLIDGQDIMKMGKEELLQVRRSKLSMVFQHFGLLPHRSVVRNVEYGLEVAGVAAAEARKSAVESLELVGLKGYEDSMPNELSGGMQQRVGLARALASSPEVLLMDEAFSALDPLIRTNMQDELLELQARMHKTIVFITHDLDEALKLGDRIGIMNDGAIVQIGTPEEILTNPADEYVERFVENVDRSKVITASSLMRKVRTITVPKDGPHVAIRAMEKERVSSIFAVDSERHLQGLLTVDDAVKLERAGKQDVSEMLQTDLFVASPDTPIADLLNTAMNARYPIAIQ